MLGKMMAAAETGWLNMKECSFVRGKGIVLRTNYGGERNKIFLDVDGNSQYL